MTRRQTKLSTEIRRALRDAGFAATRVTTGWRRRNGRCGEAKRQAGFMLKPHEDGESVVVSFAYPTLLPWQYCGVAEKMRAAKAQLEWLNSYRPVLERAGLSLEKLYNAPFERPYAVWKRRTEQRSTEG